MNGSLYERIFEETSDALFVVDAETKEIVAANPAAADLVGRERDALVGTHFSTFRPDAEQADRERIFERILEEGEVANEEFHVLTADDERIPVEMNATRIQVDGRPLVQGSLRNVSDRKALEERLRTERERYRRIFASSNDAIFVVDPEADEILDCNQRACEMLEYDHEELVGMAISKVHPDEMDRFEEFTSDVFEAGEAWTDELTCLTNSGERLPTIVAASTIEWDDDLALLACVQDISEQRQRERALEQLQYVAGELLAARSDADIADLAVEAVAEVIETPYGTVWFRDADREFRSAANTEAAAREGLPTVEDVDEFLADATRGSEGSVVEAMPTTGRESPLGCVLLVPLGDHGVLTVGVADQTPSEYDRRFVEILASNVAAALDRADREADLERTNEQLAILNRIVRHDIRNDATVLMAELERARAAVSEERTESPGDGPLGEHLDRARDAADHVVEITDTVGDLLEVVTGDSEPEQEPVDLAATVTREVDQVRSSNPAATFDVETQATPTVRANGMLSSVFRNLLNNAVDHNDGDHPNVAVDVTVEDGQAMVRIADDGPGIPDHRKDAVFGRGERGLASDGVGLGLYLVDRLVTQFDGDVTVEDAPTGGAAFEVRLPVWRDETAVD